MSEAQPDDDSLLREWQQGLIPAAIAFLVFYGLLTPLGAPFGAEVAASLFGAGVASSALRARRTRTLLVALATTGLLVVLTIVSAVAVHDSRGQVDLAVFGPLMVIIAAGELVQFAAIIRQALRLGSDRYGLFMVVLWLAPIGAASLWAEDLARATDGDPSPVLTVVCGGIIVGASWALWPWPWFSFSAAARDNGGQLVVDAKRIQAILARTVAWGSIAMLVGTAAASSRDAGRHLPEALGALAVGLLSGVGLLGCVFLLVVPPLGWVLLGLLRDLPREGRRFAKLVLREIFELR